MKSFLIIGIGKFGAHLAMRLTEMGNEVMVVDMDAENVSELVDIVDNVQVADCTKLDVLKSLGVQNFDTVFVTTATNFQSSLEITNLVKELGAKRVISKANTDIHAKFLSRNGADEVVYPEQDMAERYAVQESYDDIFSYTALSGDTGIYEMTVYPQWIGKTVMDIQFRNKYNLNILAIKNGDDTNPSISASTVFKPGDHIVVFGYQKDIHKMMEDK